MKIFGFILDITNFVIFIVSLASAGTSWNQLSIKGTLPALSLCAIVSFSLIPALEYFRKLDTNNIARKPAPPLNRHRIYFTTALPQNNPGRKLVETDIAVDNAKWQEQQQKDIQSKSATYIGWEKFLFVIGILFTLAVISYLFGFWHTPN